MIRRWYHSIRWYLQELTGEAGYQHYLTRHPGQPVMTRREYEHHRTDLREHTPNTRCC